MRRAEPAPSYCGESISITTLRAGNVTATTVELATGAGFATDPVLPFFLERYAAAVGSDLPAHAA